MTAEQESELVEKLIPMLGDFTNEQIWAMSAVAMGFNREELMWAMEHAWFRKLKPMFVDKMKIFIENCIEHLSPKNLPISPNFEMDFSDFELSEIMFGTNFDFKVSSIDFRTTNHDKDSYSFITIEIEEWDSESIIAFETYDNEDGYLRTTICGKYFGYPSMSGKSHLTRFESVIEDNPISQILLKLKERINNHRNIHYISHLLFQESFYEQNQSRQAPLAIKTNGDKNSEWRAR